MEFVRGNKATRGHAADGKDLLLFEALGKGKGIRFKGVFSCTSWETRSGPDKSGNPRRVIVFHLVPADGIEYIPPVAGTSLEELRRKAYEASRDVTERSTSDARRSYYKRSADVRAYVLARAAGTCEACKRPAPFVRLDGLPYLEPHHTRRVSDGGPDDPRWMGAVCSNCHREIHHGANGSALNVKLQEYLGSIETAPR